MSKYLKMILVLFFTFSLTFVEANQPAHISSSAHKHIQQRHWYNSGQGTSHFNKNMTTKKLNQLATKTIQQGSQRQSKHGNGRKTYQYRFNSPIGKTTNGKKAKSLRVVTDANNNVITAFPVN